MSDPTHHIPTPSDICSTYGNGLVHIDSDRDAPSTTLNDHIFSAHGPRPSLKQAIKDAIPYLEVAPAQSQSLSDEAMMPRDIAAVFYEFLLSENNHKE